MLRFDSEPEKSFSRLTEFKKLRSKLSKALRNDFKARLNTEFPAFVRDKDFLMPAGWDAYKWEITDEFWAYIVLAPSPKNDSFTVEIAWSGKREFPRRYSDVIPGEGSEGGEERLRLSQFIPPHTDRWWFLVKETSVWDDAIFDFSAPEEPVEIALGKIPGVLDEAFEQIRKYAIPYLILRSSDPQ
jgi:hypothetical protein